MTVSAELLRDKSDVQHAKPGTGEGARVSLLMSVLTSKYLILYLIVVYVYVIYAYLRVIKIIDSKKDGDVKMMDEKYAAFKRRDLERFKA